MSRSFAVSILTSQFSSFRFLRFPCHRLPCPSLMDFWSVYIGRDRNSTVDCLASAQNCLAFCPRATQHGGCPQSLPSSVPLRNRPVAQLLDPFYGEAGIHFFQQYYLSMQMGPNHRSRRSMERNHSFLLQTAIPRQLAYRALCS